MNIKDIKNINNINLNNNIDDILKKRLLITDKKQKLALLLLRQGLSRSQAIQATNKILWIHRHKARA